jgi:hypothetical protein
MEITVYAELRDLVRSGFGLRRHVRRHVPATGPLPGRTEFDNLDGFDLLRDALARYRVTIRR